MAESKSSANVEYHKFRFPITIQRTNSHIVLSSGSVSSKLAFDQLDSVLLKGVDADGFVSFEVRSRTMTTTDDFVLFHSEKSTSRGQGEEHSTYNYFKRVSTGEYAFVVVSKSGISPRHMLGSIRDDTSKIGSVLAQCPEGKWFTRSGFPSDIYANQQQVLKACLDILTKEGILQRRRVEGDGRGIYEYHKDLAIHGKVQVPVIDLGQITLS